MGADCVDGAKYWSKAVIVDSISVAEFAYGTLEGISSILGPISSSVTTHALVSSAAVHLARIMHLLWVERS